MHTHKRQVDGTDVPWVASAHGGPFKKVDRRNYMIATTDLMSFFALTLPQGACTWLPGRSGALVACVCAHAAAFTHPARCEPLAALLRDVCVRVRVNVQACRTAHTSTWQQCWRQRRQGSRCQQHRP
jgi:hypothetical protein